MSTFVKCHPRRPVGVPSATFDDYDLQSYVFLAYFLTFIELSNGKKNNLTNFAGFVSCF